MALAFYKRGYLCSLKVFSQENLLFNISFYLIYLVDELLKFSPWLQGVVIVIFGSYWGCPRGQDFGLIRKGVPEKQGSSVHV